MTNGCPNPEAEINADGTWYKHPDNIGGADFSGVINYINRLDDQCIYELRPQ
jgi:hypothetical protein